jgi:hypothetical protein
MKRFGMVIACINSLVLRKRQAFLFYHRVGFFRRFCFFEFFEVGVFENCSGVIFEII